MGWLSYYRPPGESDRDHLQRQLFDTRHTIVDSATIRTTFYAAVRDDDTGEVWGLVVLQRRSRAHFNYARKELSETMGPVEHRCPDRILDLLSPTNNEWATRWREECRAHNAAQKAKGRPARGDTVVFATPIAFRNGDVVGTFTFVERNVMTRNGMRYRIRRWRDRDYTVIPKSAGEDRAETATPTSRGRVGE